jgi:TusA-related sulfurtransferase
LIVDLEGQSCPKKENVVANNKKKALERAKDGRILKYAPEKASKRRNSMVLPETKGGSLV